MWVKIPEAQTYPNTSSDRSAPRTGKIEKGVRIPLEVKVGDTVLFGKYAGTEIKIDDREHVILREDEVLGIIK